jgi:hypothetical protein
MFGDHELRHLQTVPNTIAHRRAVGEVFVTDSTQVGEDEFVLAFQIPRAHSLWGDRRSAFHDPFSVGEAARQASFVVIHRHLGVPVGVPFSLKNYQFTVAGVPAYLDNRRNPLEGFLRYRLKNKKIAGTELGSMTIDGEVDIDGALAMTIGGDVVFLSSDDYRALRAYQRANKPLAGLPDVPAVAAYDAALVGRTDQRNVVIGPALGGQDDRYALVIDRAHPSYFDHDYDHVPGPFIVEGFRQAAIVAAGRTGLLSGTDTVLTACLAEFADFGEFEAPLEYVVGDIAKTDGGQITVTMALRQFDTDIATGTITLVASPEDVTP